jgi:hypothetical protein
LIHKDLSDVIVGALMTVLNTLRRELGERLYERAFVIEPRKRGCRGSHRPLIFPSIIREIRVIRGSLPCISTTTDRTDDTDEKGIEMMTSWVRDSMNEHSSSNRASAGAGDRIVR